MAIKNYTYHNLMIIAHKIQKKGYTEREAIDIAKRIFNEFNPYGMSIEAMTDRVLTKSEWEKENEQWKL